MQLRLARLCLDCEEVHTDQHCPVCASERFGYLSRWVPIEERRLRPRPPEERLVERNTAALRWAGGGAAGLAALALGRWFWGKGRPLPRAESSAQATERPSRSDRSRSDA